MLTVFASLPCEIKWINRDTMPAKPGAGIKRHEAKWLRFGCFNDLPDINAHRSVNKLQLINQRDIHAAENIFQKLRSLSDSTRRDRHNFVDCFAIKRHRPLKARWGITADYLRY